MCCGSGSKDTGTNTTETKPGPLTKAMATAAAQKALQIANQSYIGYDWRNRTAGINQAQRNAFGSIRDLSNTKLLDEHGPLGKMSGYIDPYMRGVLDPALREIGEQGQQARKEIGDQAQFAHAFGDARHGVEEGIQRGEEQKNVGDTTGQAYSTAWNNAVGMRQNDLTNLMNGALARLGIGDREQAQDQAGKDQQYAEFATAREWPQRQLDSLLAFLTGNPTAQTVTSTSSKPNDFLSQILGMFGSAAGGFMGA